VLKAFEDAHTILNAFCLLESLPQSDETPALFSKLSDDLFQARFFRRKAPPREYGLTPLDFAPLPDSYCRSLFPDELIAAHLKALEDEQQEDGGWPISWEPPGGTSRREWRACRTLKALITLESYRKAAKWGHPFRTALRGFRHAGRPRTVCGIRSASGPCIS
jgi:hypothetical protein